MRQDRIRNFAIIAHIDHGKSTLADRLLELTGTVDRRDMTAQVLDKMELERERGITIKLAPVRMIYQPRSAPAAKSRSSRPAGQGAAAAPPVFELNLIDTPGHVDFSYEVSRSLAACEGVILLVDATQGVQAQTLSNLYLALAADLTIIPVLNKIDLPAADTRRVGAEVVSLLGGQAEDILKISAKTGEGVERVLEAIVSQVPPPRGEPARAARALIFDSYFDDYRGVVLYVRVVDGEIAKNSHIKMMATGAEGVALEVGALKPDMAPDQRLSAGEIGYVVTNLRATREAKVGDTVTLAKAPAARVLAGYQNVQSFVYAGFFPVSNEKYQELKNAIEKLALSDSALRFTPENSPVLGFGVRAGFLGMLHLDIVRERLEREYGLELVVTNPSTDYRVTLHSGEQLAIKSAADLPEPAKIKEIREPWIRGEVVTPKQFVGQVIQLISSKRGLSKNISYVDARLAVMDFEAPLANLLTDFHDQLKSLTAGYGSFNYELAGYRAGELTRLDFYVAGEMVGALSVIVHRSEAPSVGKAVVAKLKTIIPRQNFQVSLQAAVGGKFIAREDIPAYRKDVTGGLYGGDVSRKKKVLAKQAKGKKRLKRFGKVDIPAEAFMALLNKS